MTTLDDETRQSTCHCVTWAFEQQIKPKQKLLLIAMCNQTGRQTPSLETMARDTSMSIPEINRQFQKLRVSGYIEELYGKDVPYLI